jgi:hypothetical protein
MRAIHQRYKEDLVGLTFGRLLVISVNRIDAKQRAYWYCQCKCGNYKSVRRDSLITGKVKSCGCLSRDTVRRKAGGIESTATVRVYNKYRESSRKRNLELSIPMVDFEKLIKMPCHYCGTEPQNIITRERIGDTFRYSGIDRVDNSMGYTIENTVPCCWECNQAKHIMSKDAFLKWVERVYKFSIADIED